MAHPTRRTVLAGAGALAVAPARAASWPETSWERADAAALGWSPTRLQDVSDVAIADGRTAVLIAQGGRIVAGWGDVTRKANVRSVRKSVISALYGIGIAEGRINPAATLRDLGVDDRGGLTERERSATIRDLLMARSGVYHEAAYESPDMRAKRPARGSHGPGERWFYNNWDFNALGTIYESIMGEEVFAAVERRIARPIGMEDFSAVDGRAVHEARSRHPAHTMAFSARDLARFGLLYLRQGSWKGRPVVPAAWVGQSTQPLSPGENGLAYGYLWWAMPPGMPAQALGRDAFFALGAGGQAVAVLPCRDLVVTRTVLPPFDRSERLRLRDLLQGIVAAAPG